MVSRAWRDYLNLRRPASAQGNTLCLPTLMYPGSALDDGPWGPLGMMTLPYCYLPLMALAIFFPALLLTGTGSHCVNSVSVAVWVGSTDLRENESLGNQGEDK